MKYDPAAPIRRPPVRAPRTIKLSATVSEDCASAVLDLLAQAIRRLEIDKADHEADPSDPGTPWSVGDALLLYRFRTLEKQWRVQIERLSNASLRVQ